jgi:hypothetical protein
MTHAALFITEYLLGLRATASRRREEFNDVTVRVPEEHLYRTVWPGFGRQVLDLQVGEVFHPWRKVVGLQSEMISTVVRIDRISSVTDEMEFLMLPQPEPRPWKGEGGPGNGLQFQDILIERATALNVLDMESDMVELPYLHDETIEHDAEKAERQDPKRCRPMPPAIATGRTSKPLPS